MAERKAERTRHATFSRGTESERNRAQLAAMVDQLKERISDAAEDIRHKTSPEHVKSEFSNYVSLKTHSWAEALKQRVMDNPMGTVAAGAVAAIPLVRLVRGAPLPLLMLGAGLLLTSKTARDRAAQGAASLKEKADEMLDEAGTSEVLVGMKDRLASARTQAADMAIEVKTQASQVASTWGDKVGSSAYAIRDKTIATRDAAATGWSKTRELTGDAALIGGLGIAIGAIVAAALPETRAEAKAMGQASDKVKQKAGEGVRSGFSAAKDAAMSAADAAAKSVGESDLGREAGRMTQNVSNALKEGADDVVRAAFSPSRNP